MVEEVSDEEGPGVSVKAGAPEYCPPMLAVAQKHAWPRVVEADPAERTGETKHGDNAIADIDAEHGKIETTTV